jgi:hypothetical protein
MDTRIRNIDPETWQKFKLLCLMEHISINSKIIELVNGAVETADNDHQQLAQAFAKVSKK